MVNPMKVMCPVCHRRPTVVAGTQEDGPIILAHSKCKVSFSTDRWIVVGIEAMAGKLTREFPDMVLCERRVPPHDPEGWVEYSWYLGRSVKHSQDTFKTFEEVIIDAWEHLMKENEYAD